MQQMSIGKVYDFEVFGSSIIGVDYKKVTVQTYMDYDTAKKLNGELWPLFRSMIAHLPDGLPKNPKNVGFYKIRFLDGKTVVIAETWINPASIVEVQSRTMSIIIEDVTTSDVTKVRDALSQNGYRKIDISFI